MFRLESYFPYLRIHRRTNPKKTHKNIKKNIGKIFHTEHNQLTNSYTLR